MLRHLPVLAQEVYQSLPEKIDTYFDGTLGHWWHVEYILSRIENLSWIKVIWVDRDWDILQKAKIFLDKYKNKIDFINQSYAQIELILKQVWLQKVDFFLLDLWVNLEHFKDYTRWFTIKSDAKLDMRYDKRQEFTAQDLINNYSVEQLSGLLQKYWDFSPKYSAILASNIVNARKNQNIDTTFKFKDLLRSSKLWEKQIAVVFQCIRIEVNNELWELEDFLKKFPEYINKWWRCVIMTYHSIEDRIVKYAFKELAESWKFELINKKVIKPNYKEVVQNKASRSAKLRIIQSL